MHKGKNSVLPVFLLVFVAVFIVIPFISSCGKSGSAGPSTNVQYQIVNLSPDLGSVDLYIDYRKVNTSSYFYPTASGYFYLTSLNIPFQIRPGTSLTAGTIAPSFNIFSLNNILKPNTRYTFMITGMVTDSLNGIFLTDTSATPTIGRGKIRFVNASPRSAGLNVTANDTSLFSNVPYINHTDFRELPAGIYDFKIYPTGSSTILRDIPNVTIQDGRLYTLYCYGLAGHTDSLAFGSGFITNK
ncbi:MAG: hypothetical protein JWP78_50 [Mucilaginibacter sp.]|nr:hypothetical protein [Mucilaginibacter sp.]